MRTENGKLRVENACKMNKENIIEIKAYEFAINIVKTYRQLTEKNREFILSKQLIKSGTSIGPNVKESMRKKRPTFSANEYSTERSK